MCGFRFREDVKIENDTVVASRIMAQTTTLRTQPDFIDSMKAAYHTAAQVNVVLSILLTFRYLMKHSHTLFTTFISLNTVSFMK